MRPRRDPVPRARDAWSWLGGTALLGVLGAGVVSAAVVLWERIDVRQLAPELVAVAPLPSPEPPPLPARPAVSFRAVLFDSPRNRGYFPDTTYHGSALAAWDSLLRDSGGTVRRVGTAAELTSVEASELLVLVESPCLSDAELAALRAHLSRSGSVVANWALGARGADCGWKGWSVVSELTGAGDVREIPSRRGLFLTVPGGVALSPGLDPGTRIELRPDPSLALRAEGPRVYYSDWALNPSPDESGGGADAAAIATYSSLGNGRVAWFGLRLAQAVTPMDSVRLRRLVQNGIHWAAGVPAAATHAWPGGHRAALVVALDVEDAPDNAHATADLLRARGVEGTFFVVSELVQEDADLASALAEAGEVGSQTVDHTPVAGLTPQDQAVRLRRSWTMVESWTGIAPRGLHPPEDRFDSATLEAWLNAGGTYLLATNGARSASPEVHRVATGSVLVLPRLLKDDYNVIVQDRVLRAAGLGQAYLDGIRKLRAIGGLAVVAAHTQIMRPGPRVEALGSVLESARTDGDWWIAPAGAVAEWWDTRARVRLEFAATDVAVGATGPHPGIPDLLVQAPADRAVASLWVDLVLPTAPLGLSPLVDGMPVGFVTTPWGMRVPVGDIPAGGARWVSLVPDEADGDRAPGT